MAKCMAYRDDGRICGAEAIVVDRVRGCMVCGEHAPKCERCGKPADVYGSGTPAMTDSREHHLGLNPDTARLDWLQRCNDAMNAHYGTVYGWRVHRSDWVTRLMSGRGGEGYPGDIDVYDSAPMCRDPKQAGHPTIREAIDKAMAGDGYAPPAVTPAPPSNLTPTEAEAVRLARHQQSAGKECDVDSLLPVIARLQARCAAATEAKERAERGVERLAFVSQVRTAQIDAYHAIRESLGMAPDTDPQEVVDQVGRMREALKRFVSDFEGDFVSCASGEIVDDPDGRWGVLTELYHIAKSALAAQPKERSRE